MKQNSKKYSAAVIVMLFDENGQADSTPHEIEIEKQAMIFLVNKVNFPPRTLFSRS